MKYNLNIIDSWKSGTDSSIGTNIVKEIRTQFYKKTY